jgi:hypothetical protein
MEVYIAFDPFKKNISYDLHCEFYDLSVSIEIDVEYISNLT